ncbi:hypothetical protein [Photobacterium swingsii]|uniref:hypothetical protein n=1 Tax=Photobacterium swingsii TaxID=680026 RepID=UPI003D112ECE
MASKSIARYGYFSLDSIVQCKIKHRNNKIQINLVTRKKLVPFSCNKRSQGPNVVTDKQIESEKIDPLEPTNSRLSSYRLAGLLSEVFSLKKKLNLKNKKS